MNSSSDRVSKLVCEVYGHKLTRFISTSASRSPSKETTMCVACGKTLEEIKEEIKQESEVTTP